MPGGPRGASTPSDRSRVCDSREASAGFIGATGAETSTSVFGCRQEPHKMWMHGLQKTVIRGHTPIEIRGYGEPSHPQLARRNRKTQRLLMKQQDRRLGFHDRLLTGNTHRTNHNCQHRNSQVHQVGCENQQRLPSPSWGTRTLHASKLNPWIVGTPVVDPQSPWMYNPTRRPHAKRLCSNPPRSP